MSEHERCPFSVLSSAHNTISNIRHACQYECAFRETRNILKFKLIHFFKLRYDGGKECKLSYSGAYGGIWRSMLLAGV
jgi:hypothetical protein